MSEQKLQAKINLLLARKGAYVVKVISASKAGVPDILACYKGVFLAIEVKTGVYKVSALQEANLRLIADAGGLAICARSTDHVLEALAKIDLALEVA